MQSIDLINWRSWALDRVRADETVFRLTLMRYVGEMRVKALILNSIGQDDDAALGIIRYDNQPNPHVSCSSRHALECVVVGNNTPGGWNTDLALRTSLEEEWVAKSRTVCVFHDLLDRDWKYISPGSFLAMEYIARIYGMIYQSAATEEDLDKKAALRKAEERLDQLLRHKRRDIASLAAGL